MCYDVCLIWMPIDREFPITMFDYLIVSPEKSVPTKI